MSPVTDVPQLRDWAQTQGQNIRAAFELLDSHGHWLTNDYFAYRCIDTFQGTYQIYWPYVKAALASLCDHGTAADITILRFSLFLAEDSLGLASLSDGHRELLFREFGYAMGFGL